MTHDVGDGYVIRTDPGRIQPDAVCEALGRTYGTGGSETSAPRPEARISN